jgi:very-short-patch-repair endonuclease
MRVEMRTHRPLGDLATRQHGVVSRGQLLELGYSEAAIGRAMAAGRLHRIHRGVYAVGHARLSKHGRSLAAVLACGRGAVTSHFSAGWLWGLFPECPILPEVTVPGRGHTRAGIRIHFAPALSREDRAVREGIPATSLARTLLDLAARIPSRRLERAIERSEQLRVFDLGEIDDLLTRTTRHPGAKRLRRTLAAYRDPAFTRSGLERAFLDLVRRAGLPRPAMNTFVAGYEIDAYWERERFAVELDGYATHGTRAAFERDRIRQEDLKLAGIEMTRLTASRIDREPEAVVQRLTALLAARRREQAG